MRHSGPGPFMWTQCPFGGTQASEPIFNAAAAAILYQERRPRGVYLSLIPIAFGISFASVKEMSFNVSRFETRAGAVDLPSDLFCLEWLCQAIGFTAAMVAALMKVLQNLYNKRVMLKKSYGFFEVRHGRLHVDGSFPPFIACVYIMLSASLDQ